MLHDTLASRNYVVRIAGIVAAHFLGKAQCDFIPGKSLEDPESAFAQSLIQLRS